MRASRVAVIGSSGSGKTTVARRLAERLGVPHVELDALVHGPNWTEISDEELRERLLAETALSGWVVDGNYERKLGDLVLDRAELIVWLDLPLRVKLTRLAQRTSGRIRRRELLWNGNRESWRGALVGWESLFVWAIRTHFRHRRRWPARLAGREHMRLRSPDEVESWFRQLDGGRR